MPGDGLPHLPMQRFEVAGGTVIVIEDHSLPVVDFGLFARRGAGHDAPGAAGELRILTELMLRGTTRRTYHEYAVAVERLGSDIGASVGVEAGGFRGSCLRRHADETLDLLTEAVCAPAFDPEACETLIAEVREGLRAERDDDDTLVDRFALGNLYGDHPFARGSDGLVQDLPAITPATLRALHADRFRAPDLILALAGDIAPADARRWAEDLFGGLSSAPCEARVLSSPTLPEKPAVLLVDKPERTQAQLRLGFVQDACLGDDALPFWLGVMAFAGTFTSPFCREVRDQRGWSYTASGTTRRHARYPVPFVLRSAPQVADLEACVKLEIELLQKFCTTGPSEEELEAVRSYVLGRYPFDVATASDLLLPAVDLELLARPLSDLYDFPKRLAAVTREAVLAALARYARADCYCLTMVASGPDVADWLPELGASVSIVAPDAELCGAGESG